MTTVTQLNAFRSTHPPRDRSDDEKLVAGSVRQHSKALGLSHVLIEGAVDAALKKFADCRTVAFAIGEGKQVAERYARRQNTGCASPRSPFNPSPSAA